MKRINIILCLVILVSSCSSSSLTIGESFNQSVLVKTKSGEMIEGIVVDVNDNELLLLRANTKVMVKLVKSNIGSIERSQNYYDLEGYVISKNTIIKDIDSSNDLVYSIIGTLSGSILGAMTIGQIGSKTSFISGLVIGGLGGGYYGYQIGEEVDIIKAVDKIKLKRKALKNLEKQIESGTNDKQD